MFQLDTPTILDRGEYYQAQFQRVARSITPMQSLNE